MLCKGEVLIPLHIHAGLSRPILHQEGLACQTGSYVKGKLVTTLQVTPSVVLICPLSQMISDVMRPCLPYLKLFGYKIII